MHYKPGAEFPWFGAMNALLLLSLPYRLHLVIAGYMFHVFFCYKMDQSFTRIEVGCLNYYLLTKLVDGGKEGFDLTVCDGDQVWRQKGEPLLLSVRK